MALIVHDVALELIATLRPLMPAIGKHDKDLARQLRRAASPIVLNIAEGEHSDGGNRRARFHTAAGSASETRSALRVAMAWRYLQPGRADRSLELLDRVLAMLWRLRQ